jgi:hypothetical protein
MLRSVAPGYERRCFHGQTAHLVPAARFLRPGLAPLLRSPESRGGRSAERRSGACEAPVGRIMTRYARRLARRLASHNAGRSPLGAPPRRFWASGPRFRLLGRPSPYNGGHLPFGSVQRAPRSQVVVPGGRGPGPPEASGCEPPPQDATPRSAFRIASGDAPHERGCECSNVNALCSQQCS